MGTDRILRINELLRREVGEALYHVVNEKDFDISAVTITSVSITRDLREARVLVSIRDHREERGNLMSLIRKHRPEIQERINANLRLKYTPRLSFEVDHSLEKGDHVLSLLSQIERETESTKDATPADPDTGNVPRPE
jgi:ribosome-binding factor A